MKGSKEVGKSNSWLLPTMGGCVAIAVIGWIIMVLAYNSHFTHFFPLSDNPFDMRAYWGEMGDFFGGTLNPLFAFLGLIMLLATIYQNQVELRLTRDEMKKSADALENQSITLAKQQEVMDKQQFETTFFNMLRLQSEITEAVSHVSIRKQIIRGEAIKGKKCLEQMYVFFKNQYFDSACSVADLSHIEYEPHYRYQEISEPDFNALRHTYKERLSDLDAIKPFYKSFYQTFIYSLEPYFNNLQTVSRFIVSSNLVGIDKEMYQEILSNQLSTSEKALLFYHCVLTKEHETLKIWANTCGLFEGLESNKLIAHSHMDYLERL